MQKLFMCIDLYLCIYVCEEQTDRFSRSVSVGRTGTDRQNKYSALGKSSDGFGEPHCGRDYTDNL